MNNENKIMYKELSYKLQGLIFDIRNDLGSGHKESIYQKALEKELSNAGIKFTKEPAIKIYSRKGDYLGLYRPDFLIEGKIIVELKAISHISRQEMARVYDYLRNSKYELAYLVNFASPKLYIKRFIFTNDKKGWLKNLVVLFVAISTLFVGVRGVQAAELQLNSQTSKISVGQEFQIDLALDTEVESINAVEGKIVFPGDLIKVKDLNDGNTVISLWIQKPKSVDNNQIVFVGIIPGGYNGRQGKVFSMRFQATKEGSGIIQVVDSKTLLNDGNGTEAPLKISNFPFVAIRAPIRGDSWVSPKDTERPESFVPKIAKDATLFDGKWFVVFATQDKISGIDRYFVHESQRMKKQIATNLWEEVESPYVLKDQNLRSFIYIKAVDKTGNERIAVVEPRYPIKWYEVWWIWSIIIVVIISIYFVKRTL